MKEHQSGWKLTIKGQSERRWAWRAKDGPDMQDLVGHSVKTGFQSKCSGNPLKGIKQRNDMMWFTDKRADRSNYSTIIRSRTWMLKWNFSEKHSFFLQRLFLKHYHILIVSQYWFRLWKSVSTTWKLEHWSLCTYKIICLCIVYVINIMGCPTLSFVKLNFVKN